MWVIILKFLIMKILIIKEAGGTSNFDCFLGVLSKKLSHAICKKLYAYSELDKLYSCNRLKILNPKIWGYSGVIYKLRVDCKKESVRILFVKTESNNLVMLHGFIKKTRKTPNKEAKIAIHKFNQLGVGENLRPLNLNKYFLMHDDVKSVSI